MTVNKLNSAAEVLVRAAAEATAGSVNEQSLRHELEGALKQASGTCLTGESDLGFPILVVRANLSHAHRNIHHSHGL